MESSPDPTVSLWMTRGTSLWQTQGMTEYRFVAFWVKFQCAHPEYFTLDPLTVPISILEFD